MKEQKLVEINDFWYTITRNNRESYDTVDKEEAKRALREGSEVDKTTRKMFESGPAIIRLTASVEIKKISDL